MRHKLRAMRHKLRAMRHKLRAMRHAFIVVGSIIRLDMHCWALNRKCGEKLAVAFSPLCTT
jgi:hypothetical protein